MCVCVWGGVPVLVGENTDFSSSHSFKTLLEGEHSLILDVQSLFTDSKQAVALTCPNTLLLQL